MRWILAAEVAAVLLFLAGVAMVFVPAALMLGGVLGVVALERASVQVSARPASEPAGLRRVA